MTVAVRARGGQPARTAIVEVRSARVTLDGPWRPGGWQAPLGELGVVEVREVHAPAGVKEPLHWLLLTSLPCATWAQAQRVVGYYTARWWIEEYHKALKTGTGVETSQLERADHLEPLIAVLGVVAVRLLNTKLLARSRPESFEAAASFGPQYWHYWRRNWARPRAVGPIGISFARSRGWADSSDARATGNRVADHLARLATVDVDVRRSQPN